jgi:hypothetical protein
VEGGFELAQAIAKQVVKIYAKLYFLVMHSLGRRQEIAADAFSARLAGSAASARSLEKEATCGPLYMHYLQADVGYALLKGAMPSDLWAGFERCREEMLSSEPGARFVEALRTERTDPYDTHPALPERLGAFAAWAAQVETSDDSPSARLLAPELDLDAWLCDATKDKLIAAAVAGDQSVPAVQHMPWTSIASDVYLPAAQEAARRVAEALFPLFGDATTIAAMFRRAVEARAGGKAAAIVTRIHPGIAGLPPTQAAGVARRVYGEVLTSLFQGALIEKGACVEESFGAPCLVLRVGDERVAAARLVAEAMGSTEGAERLSGWAERLGGAGDTLVPGGPH